MAHEEELPLAVVLTGSDKKKTTVLTSQSALEGVANQGDENATIKKKKKKKIKTHDDEKDLNNRCIQYF